MTEDEDDPVVDEIPVYLTQELSDKLFIFQYPVHPASSNVQNFNIEKSQIKPDLQEVILEVGLDTTSANYDRSHGEQIASSIDKDKTSQNKNFPSNMMDRIRYESTRAIIDKDSYAVGKMRGKQLIISPLRGVVSLLPNFSHITQEDDKESEGDEEEEEQPKMVRVQFSRIESEKSKKAREASYNYFCQKSAEEPWYYTEYHDVESTLSKLERAKMTSSNSASGSDDLMDLTSLGYIDCLLPKENEMDGITPEIPESLSSINHLRQLTLRDQVKHVLFDVKVLNAQQLSWMLKTSNIDDIIQCLQTYAVMVLGNWVLRSDLLYSNTHNGIPPETMIRARDYILYQFQQGKTLERKALSALVGLPQEELREIMSQVGVLRRATGWHFKLPPDTSLIERFPEVVEQQNLLWEARAKGFLDSLQCMPTPSKQPRKRKESETLAAVAFTGRQKKLLNSDSEHGNVATNTAVTNSSSATASSAVGKKVGRNSKRRVNSEEVNVPFSLVPSEIKIKQELPENT